MNDELRGDRCGHRYRYGQASGNYPGDQQTGSAAGHGSLPAARYGSVNSEQKPVAKVVNDNTPQTAKEPDYLDIPAFLRKQADGIVAGSWASALFVLNCPPECIVHFGWIGNLARLYDDQTKDSLNVSFRRLASVCIPARKSPLTLRPAPANTGVIYRRTDLNPPVDFPADAKSVRDTMLCTCLW